MNAEAHVYDKLVEQGTFMVRYGSYWRTRQSLCAGHLPCFLIKMKAASTEILFRFHLPRFLI